MAPICRGQCVNFKTEWHENRLRYQNGLKWCAVCSKFLRELGYRCPCCNTKLRVRSKHGRNAVIERG